MPEAAAQGSSSTRPIRRRPGPFKRSRTGCGTCKRRGKKCDEQWDAQGHCERCTSGGWKCSGKSIALALAAAASSSGDLANGELGSSSMDDRGGRPQSPSLTPAPTLLTSPILSLPPSSTGPLPPSSTEHRTPTDPSPGLSAWAALGGLPSPASTSQPLFSWPTATNTPSAFLTTTDNGSLAIDANWTTGWADLDALFAPPDALATGSSNPLGALGSGSRVLFLNSDKPMRQGVSLAEIYARVVESWLVGLPSKAREYARARIMALNDNNNAMRKVRYAVAAAYIFLFASAANPADPKPKLVELALRGAGVSPPNNHPASELATKIQHPATRKLRLYVDSVSTPFASDLESTKWTDDAVQELRQVLVTDQAQLSDLLWGVIDLQLVEFIRGGAAPSYNMLALGDRLVRSALGHYPPITLAQLRTPETFSLRLFALSDISRCLVQRGRRTLFNFWSDHPPPLSSSSPPAPPPTDQEEPWAAYLGLPDSIVIILAEIANLAADLHLTSAADVKGQADELESALRNWEVTLPSGLSDPMASISRTMAGQLWRLCALILLYQSVHRVGPLHPVLRQSRSDLLDLLDSIVRLPNGDLWGFIGLPAFLASVLAVSDSDRQRAMEHLNRPGPERMWLDNIALVEKVWEETDQTGRMPDWHDKMTREGLSIAFF